MHPQGITHVGVDPLCPQTMRLLFDTVETRIQFDYPLSRIGGFKIMFEESQFAIQPEYPSLYLPGIHGRKYPQQGIEDANQGNQQHQQAFDQHSQPEWEMLLQVGAAGPVELPRLVAQREVDRLCRGELSGLLKHPRS